MIFIYNDMITKFKIFEAGIYKYGFIDADSKYHHNIDKMLCIDNRIGELEDTYDFTIGKIYNVKRYKTFVIEIIDDKGKIQYFDSNSLFKNFSTDASYDDYLMKKDAGKYNL